MFLGVESRQWCCVYINPSGACVTNIWSSSSLTFWFHKRENNQPSTGSVLLPVPALQPCSPPPPSLPPSTSNHRSQFALVVAAVITVTFSPAANSSYCAREVPY